MYRAILVAAGFTLSAGPALAAPATPDVAITARDGNDWTVTYQFGAPLTALVFQRSPDESRGTDWKAPPGFEIVSTSLGETLRRTDGASFRSVSLDVPPVYRELPKDYAPFSPFGDGGSLVHTGRFFACANSCGEAESWRFRLTAPPGAAILVNGARLAGSAEWTDDGSGRNIYVGPAQPLETEDFFAVVDEALPAPIRRRLLAQLPHYMHHFSEKLGALPEKPMLFASYDTSQTDGRYGRQGGTLPGQVFTHFYGKAWPELMAAPDFPNELAWFFAHEAAHLYQRQLFGADSADAWIHEGGAEAMAALAMRASGGGEAFIARQIQEAEARCAKERAGQSVQDAINAGRFDAAYACGLLLNLRLDAEIRKVSPEKDGLYAVWRDYIARSAKEGAGEQTFLRSIATVGGPDLATQIARAVRSGKD